MIAGWTHPDCVLVNSRFHVSGRQVIVAQGGRELETLVATHGRAKLCLCLVHDTLSERAALWRP